MPRLWNDTIDSHRRAVREATIDATAALVAEHGLTPDEYGRLERLLGRTPTFTELGIVSALWNEHCSYKHSRPVLRTLPTKAPHVLQGPGASRDDDGSGGGRRRHRPHDVVPEVDPGRHRERRGDVAPAEGDPHLGRVDLAGQADRDERVAGGQLHGFTTGAGVRIPIGSRRFLVDYAYRNFGDLESNHAFSFELSR